MKSNSIYLIIFLSTLFHGCSPKMRSRQIADVKANEVIWINKQAQQGSICGLLLRIRGNLLGSAEMSLMLNDEPYRKNELFGKIDVEWAVEWYSDNAEIRFSAVTSTGGYLRIDYEFHDY